MLFLVLVCATVVVKPYVFLNTIKSAESSRFDAAHELAHLVLHQDGSVAGRLAEDQANRFASAFLMPRADVLSVLPRVQHLQQLIDKKSRWRVSLAALNYRQRVHHIDAASTPFVLIKEAQCSRPPKGHRRAQGGLKPRV